MTTHWKWTATAALAVMTAALSGCGGDSGDDTPPAPAVTSAVPASASATPTGFIAYLRQLVVAAADTLEPVDVSAVTPQTSDTTEPESVD